MPDIKVQEFDLRNEPVLEYLPGSQERKDLEKALKEASNETKEVPIVIGDKEYKTSDVQYQVKKYLTLQETSSKEAQASCSLVLGYF